MSHEATDSFDDTHGVKRVQDNSGELWPCPWLPDLYGPAVKAELRERPRACCRYGSPANKDELVLTKKYGAYVTSLSEVFCTRSCYILLMQTQLGPSMAAGVKYIVWEIEVRNTRSSMQHEEIFKDFRMNITARTL